jgi:hypothetical protein
MDYILKTLNVTIGFYYSMFLILLIHFPKVDYRSTKFQI